MDFLQKLDFLMANSELNKHKLSKISGVPYTTIDGFYKKGYENAKISNIRKIAKALNVSLDYLIEDDSLEKIKTPSGKDEELSNLFHQLNEEGQYRLLEYADDLVQSGKYIKLYSNELDKDA